MKEVTRYNKEFINKNRAFGELGHHDGATVNLERVSHMIKNFILMAITLLVKRNHGHAYGKIVKGLIDEGVSIGSII